VVMAVVVMIRAREYRSYTASYEHTGTHTHTHTGVRVEHRDPHAYTFAYLELASDCNDSLAEVSHHLAAKARDMKVIPSDSREWRTMERRCTRAPHTEARRDVNGID
jgi:hypothetical protein